MEHFYLLLSGTLSRSPFRTVTRLHYLNLDLKYICSPPSMLLNCPVRQRLWTHSKMALDNFVLYTVDFNSQPLRGLSNVQICLHYCCAIVLDVFFLLPLCFYIVYYNSCHISTVLCHITVSWISRILALVLQLYQQNKLKVHFKKVVISKMTVKPWWWPEVVKNSVIW